jgi:hypothetical protein
MAEVNILAANINYDDRTSIIRGMSDRSLDKTSVQARSLDDPSWFEPAVDLYVASAQPWDYLNPELPKFVKFPPPN